MKLHYFILALIVAIIGMVSAPIYIMANQALTVNGLRLESNVNPGQVIEHKFSIGLGQGDSSMNISVEALDLGSRSARDFITFSDETLHIKPGETKTITAIITMPINVTDGGYYSLLRVAQIPDPSANINSLVAIEAPILLNLKNGVLIHTGKIVELTTSDAESNKPVEINTNFQNTGNHHYKIKGEISLFDNSSNLLDTIHISLTPYFFFPSVIRPIQATYIPQSNLPAGIYNIKSKVMLEDGTLLDEETGSFEVREPYIPPPAPASTIIKPASASTLRTDDGRISIDFPAGAVLGDAQLALRSYSPDQLPSPPAGYVTGTTAFRVDGLNGLLAKPASVNVKYSTADLNKAGGDPFRLVLARWDEAGSQWTILKTSLDSRNQALGTETNQFSIWAVLIGPTADATAVSAPTIAAASAVTAAAGGPNRVIIGAVILLAVIVVLYLIFFFVILKPRRLNK